MILKPYIICKGRKFKREKLKKLKKPISCIKNSVISNYNLSEKNKIRFVTQLFRWFQKDSKYYRLNYYLKEKYYISECDTLDLSVKIQKAGWKKLLLKLNYYLEDYKELKRRSYTLNFTFFFINVKDFKNNDLTVDIKARKFDVFNIFITTGGYYIEDFYNLITILKIEICRKKDQNDDMLEDLKYIYSWNRVNNVIIAYDMYMPWYLSKEKYNFNRNYKKKIERKYLCFIKEKKFNSIFPLKNVSVHLIVTDIRNKNDNDFEYIFWKTFLRLNFFKKKDNLFKEIKKCVNRINRLYSIVSTIVYIHIQCLK